MLSLDGNGSLISKETGHVNRRRGNDAVRPRGARPLWHVPPRIECGIEYRLKGYRTPLNGPLREDVSLIDTASGQAPFCLSLGMTTSDESRTG